MRPLSIAGILLVVVGAFIVFRGLSYGSQRNVMRIGDVQVAAEEQRAIPAWIGGVAIVGGVLLLSAGVRRRRGA
ncbi:MAG TPA: hypothetical protein VNH14_11165 [Gemmatimonadales bacterium]|nr:hypothetical protein [Gemmatimonadales bacterium]